MLLACLQGGLKKTNFKILKGVTGALRPGTTTLLLGPPGSGKSVFMQALTGRLATGANVRVRRTGPACDYARTRSGQPVLHVSQRRLPAAASCAAAGER